MQTLKAKQASYYAETAARYDSMHVHADDEHYCSLRYMRALCHLHEIRTILDVGCGTGRGVGCLRGSGFSAVGIEPVPELLVTGQRMDRIAGGRAVVGSGEHLPFRDLAFDSCCEFGMLHHVSNPSTIVREMMRVSRKAIFLSDCNRFAQGRLPERLAKLLLYKAHLWPLANFIKNGGHRYSVSEGDGISYSYSVYDSYEMLADWATVIILIPTTPSNVKSWGHPLLTAPHLLLCALRHAQGGRFPEMGG